MQVQITRPQPLTPWQNRNALQPLPESGLISPADHKVVQLEITNRCFLSCSNCTRLVAHQREPYEMDRETFTRAVDTLADHPGMVGIMGGEPTLHRDFDWLVRHYAAVIDPGCRYEHVRSPVLDLARYREQRCASLHHRRGIWSATGPSFLRHLELISDVFGYWCLNDHAHSGKHEALLLARRDLGVPDDVWYPLRDRCWIQRTWSSSINPAGAYFCEVAAAIDWTLFSGKRAWPIEPNWWKRTPADFGPQLELCEYCSAPLSGPARLPAECKDDVSPRLYQLLTAAGSPRAKRGDLVVTSSLQAEASAFGVETYMQQENGAVDNAVRVSPDNRWIRPQEIVGLLVCVDFHQWLPEVLHANLRHFNRYVVVTTPEDKRTQEIAAAAGCDVLQTDVCYSDGAAFNKGKMLNAGLDFLRPRDWVLFSDADVLLAPHWGEWIRGRVLNPGVLYHARRLHAYDDSQWGEALVDWSTIDGLSIRDPAADLLPFGFHQLWNVRASAIAGRSPIVSQVFPTAATVDYHFYRMWAPDKRVRLPDELSIVHRWHGPFAARWANRGVPRGGWEWIGQVSPVGPLWFLRGKEPRYPCRLKLIDLDTEQSEVIECRTPRRLPRVIGNRVVDVYREKR